VLFQPVRSLHANKTQGVALTLTPIAKEFGVSENESRFATCSLFVGLIIGASFWGIASDAIGRRPAFNMTLCICGTFGLAAGGGPNWVGCVISSVF
jgi:MFS family permease